MYVAVGYIKIRIYESYSLKDRRQVVRSVVSKLQNKFNVSISELDSGEIWNIAEIGTAAVSSSRKILESVHQQIGKILDEDHRFEVVDYEVDIQKEI